jgi:DNA-binding transcriptional LysR family regulator
MRKCMPLSINKQHHAVVMKKDLIKETKGGIALEDWNLLRSFIAIYETGTLTEAATRLATTQPSMGRHLRELEAQINETLFVRLPGRLKPNARADALFEAILPMRHSIREAEGLFANMATALSGVVRVAVAETYAYHVIPAILLPLLDKHPELEVELSVSNQTDNLLRRDADIAVRFFRPVQDDLIAVKVGETSLGMYAHEDYLSRHGVPTELELAAGHIVSGNDREPLPRTGVIHGAPPKQPIRFRFRTDFVLAREASAMAGHTMSMMFVDIARTKPQLKRILADRINLKQEVWLCAHEELKRSPRMRLVWEQLEVSLRARFSQSGG